MSETIDKKESIKKEITWYGHTQRDEHGPECGNCVEQDKYLSELQKSEPISVKHVDVYTEEGQKARNEKKFDNMPYTVACEIDNETGERKNCEEWEGFDKNRLKKSW